MKFGEKILRRPKRQTTIRINEMRQEESCNNVNGTFRIGKKDPVLKDLLNLQNGRSFNSQ